MSEEQRKLLQRQLWSVADTLRGKMDADEFRDYMLGFIFYKYLSEKMTLYADKILEGDKIRYDEIDERTKKGKAILKVVNEQILRIKSDTQEKCEVSEQSILNNFEMLIKSDIGRI